MNKLKETIVGSIVNILGILGVLIWLVVLGVFVVLYVVGGIAVSAGIIVREYWRVNISNFYGYK